MAARMRSSSSLRPMSASILSKCSFSAAYSCDSTPKASVRLSSAWLRVCMSSSYWAIFAFSADSMRLFSFLSRCSSSLFLATTSFTLRSMASTLSCNCLMRSSWSAVALLIASFISFCTDSISMLLCCVMSCSSFCSLRMVLSSPCVTCSFSARSSFNFVCNTSRLSSYCLSFSVRSCSSVRFATSSSTVVVSFCSTCARDSFKYFMNLVKSSDCSSGRDMSTCSDARSARKFRHVARTQRCICLIKWISLPPFDTPAPESMSFSCSSHIHSFSSELSTGWHFISTTVSSSQLKGT
mmetsp:Transcript_19488/g.43416  ORF Transcript_19488/g.43416 Transcript_19488/m.43416 type:complete len:296 (+) Transcript_19488:248-1135(+)